ncbi:sulfite reductase subunit alpha [Aureliella helgolandensis]|uniref:assimilatory sulfite reductase (NADPH) n=1 Tax=Aureliella helgolandensis TaxID=2527968 RepID=A0A518GGT2_9BACT|nr:sulfite reductase subunit alpha [Aureliella helgolandensis]QDV27787.1 Sulfite reductase [NADPH] flavoprotein alpha-component [Aureliella helgolandensis]
MATSILPETAPFTEEQRAWLNGFFAGIYGMDEPPVAAMEHAMATVEEIGTSPVEEDEDYPWHDAALEIEERMVLAEGQPMERRMMAAMAQLDCGACGYECKSYSEAIAQGNETNLTLCVPGGRETSRLLKTLVKEIGVQPTAPKSIGASSGQSASAKTWSRANPYPASLLESRKLNGIGSAKDTRHVAIDLGDSGLEYHVGDALGVYPSNCDDLVSEIVSALGVKADHRVDTERGLSTLALVLRDECCLKAPTEELLDALCSATGDEGEQAKLKQLLDDDSELDGCDVLDVLKMFPSAVLDPQTLVASLGTLNPRLYSIASSLKANPGQVHLTVGKVTWGSAGRLRKGAASTMLAERVGVGGQVRVFVHKSHGFTVPANPAAPMMMVGPGTGIAPFMAFLQERHATQATGKNWLFFGDQCQATDYLYQAELAAYQASGLLSRLDTAFSRDQERKVYVQDKMREQAAEVWSWLEAGGYFFVCGDASRMAVDVEKTLLEIIQSEGGMDAVAAKAYLKRLSDDKRYSRDVY